MENGRKAGVVWCSQDRIVHPAKSADAGSNPHHHFDMAYWAPTVSVCQVGVPDFYEK